MVLQQVSLSYSSSLVFFCYSFFFVVLISLSLNGTTTHCFCECREAFGCHKSNYPEKQTPYSLRKRPANASQCSSSQWYSTSLCQWRHATCFDPRTPSNTTATTSTSLPNSATTILATSAASTTTRLSCSTAHAIPSYSGNASATTSPVSSSPTRFRRSKATTTTTSSHGNAPTWMAAATHAARWATTAPTHAARWTAAAPTHAAPPSSHVYASTTTTTPRLSVGPFVN